MDDVRGDFLGLPHGTTPAVKTLTIQESMQATCFHSCPKFKFRYQ